LVVKELIKFDGDYEKLKDMKNSAGKIAKDLVNNESTLLAFHCKKITYK